MCKVVGTLTWIFFTEFHKEKKRIARQAWFLYVGVESFENISFPCTLNIKNTIAAENCNLFSRDSNSFFSVIIPWIEISHYFFLLPCFLAITTSIIFFTIYPLINSPSYNYPYSKLSISFSILPLSLNFFEIFHPRLILNKCFACKSFQMLPNIDILFRFIFFQICESN